MNKEEILAKSREEKNDEGVAYAANRGRRYGVSAMCLMMIVLIVFNWFQGQNNYAIFAILWSYLGLEAYGTYQVTREKARLAAAVLGIAAGILFCIAYFLKVLL